MTTATVPQEPGILTTTTFYWTPAPSAGSRGRNEIKRNEEVADYLTSLGFTVTRYEDKVIGEHASGVYVRFQYTESCKNVHKSFHVERDGKNSNIRAIRKISAAL